MIKNITIDKRGFSLMELMVVIIIVAALSSLAFPNLRTVFQRSKNSEAEQILLAVYGAQLDYALDRGFFTDNIADLDLTVPAASDNFKDLVVDDGTSSDLECGVTVSFLASWTESNDEYILAVVHPGTDNDGQIYCFVNDGADFVCDGNTICRRFGFPSAYP